MAPHKKWQTGLEEARIFWPLIVRADPHITINGFFDLKRHEHVDGDCQRKIPVYTRFYLPFLESRAC